MALQADNLFFYANTRHPDPHSAPQETTAHTQKLTNIQVCPYTTKI